LEEASGLDEGTLKRVVDFLVRWEFVESKHFPELQIRRKAGTISPVEVVSLLRSVTTSQPELLIPGGRGRLAERVACSACGGRSLRVIGENEVECNRCSERQWYTIERRSGIMEGQRTESEAPTAVKRFLVRLGFRQFAFTRGIPRPTKFYWFRCSSCKKVGSDYQHGHARYFMCPNCGTRTIGNPSPEA